MAVSIASREKLILSYFRASISQESGQIVWPSPSLDKYRRGETEKADFKETTDQFASIKTQKVLSLLECYSAYTRKGWIYWRFNGIVPFEHK